LVKRFTVKDRRVRAIAEIVHEADLHDGKFTRNEAIGVDLAINGLVEATPDDDELLARGMGMFEGLYADPARLAEEVGELAREVNHRFGQKTKKKDEAEAPSRQGRGFRRKLDQPSP
jgi:hypothetical protein